jgi:tetratricopeptide (TPR) repeat protein
MTDAGPFDRKSASDRDIEAYRSLLERLSQAGSTRFVGNPPLPPLPRDGDVVDRAELRDLLKHMKARDGSALLLVGPGGVGKTALVHALVRNLENEPPGLTGVVYLSSRHDLTFERLYMLAAELLGGDAEAAMITRWNDRKASTMQKSRVLIRQLLLNHRRTYLLVFDDLLPVDSRADIFPKDMQTFFEVLAQTPGRERLKLLLTSRRDIAANYALEPFPLRRGFAEETGVAFLERHVRMDANLATELVRLVAGAPRGLHLIASNLKQGMTPAEVLSLLRSGPHDDLEARIAVLARHNYDRLDAADAAVVRILAVFGEAMPKVAIAFVLKALGKDGPIAASLKRLAALRTVHVEMIGDDRATVKLYSVHDIDAQVAMPEPAELAELHRLASVFYGRLRRRPPFSSMRDLLMHMLQFRHLQKAGEPLAASAVLDEVDYSQKNHHKYLAALVSLGRGSFSADRRGEVAALLEGADTPADGEGRAALASAAQNRTSRAWVFRRLNNKTEARQNYERALAIAEAAQDDPTTIYARSEYGYFLTDNDNQHGRARELLDSALASAVRRGDLYSQGHCTLGLAFADFQTGAAEACERNALDALRLFQSSASHQAPYREVDCLVRLSMLYRKEGRIADAEARTLEASAIAENHRLYGWPGELQSQLGFHRRSLAQYEPAISHHQAALELMLDLRREAAVQYSYIGNLEIEIGKFDSARESFNEALDIATRIEVSRERSWILANRGILCWTLGDYDEALQNQEQGLAIVRDNEHLDSEIIRWTDLAETYLVTDNWDKSCEALSRALGVSPHRDASTLAAAFADLPPNRQKDDLPHEMQMPGHFARQGTILARLLLERALHEAAARVVRAALLGPEAIGRRPRLLLLEAIASMQAGHHELARASFEAAKAAADAVRVVSHHCHDAAYIQAMALSGRALVGSKDGRDEKIDAARTVLQEAMALCSAAGVTRDNNALLRLLRIVDNEGLIADFQINIAPPDNSRA